MHTTFTATNKANLLQQIKNAVVGGTGSGWTLKKDSGSELILQNTGKSGTQNVVVGFQISANGLRLMTATGYVEGIAFDAQPGVNASVYMPCWDSSMPCWLVHDASLITLVAKVSTVYEVGSVGLLDTLVPTASYPAALFCGGTAQYSTISYTQVDDSHYAFACEPPYNNGVAKLRDTAGTYAMYNVFEPNLDNGYPQVNIQGNTDGTELILPLVFNNIVLHPHCCAVVGSGISAESIVSVGSQDYLVVQNVYRTGQLFALKLA